MVSKSIINRIYLLFLISFSIEVFAVDKNKLDVCSNKPNCVSSLDKRNDFNIKPLPQMDISALKKIVLKMPGAKLSSESDNFLHIIFTSKLFRFKDDVKFVLSGSKVDISSKSRAGHSDLGVNRKRVERIRKLIDEGSR